MVLDSLVFFAPTSSLAEVRDDPWISYRGVIYFLLGTQRARELWAICSPYFNPKYVEMVAGMVDGTPTTDFWERLETVP